jgi:transposase-like protein
MFPSPFPSKKEFYTLSLQLPRPPLQRAYVTNNKRVFPSDDSVFKTLYLTINYITAKWTMPIQNWGEAMAHFLIKFDGRI